MKRIFIVFNVLILFGCNSPDNRETIPSKQASKELSQDGEILFPILGIDKNPDRKDLLIDTILCDIKNQKFLLTPEGNLKWGPDYDDSLKLKTDVFIERAFFYLIQDTLLIFYTETDMEGATSRIEKIDLVEKESVWQQEIYGFNLGTPYILSNFVYVSAIGMIGKINLQTGKFDFQFKELYDDQKYSFNSFDTIIFKDSLTYFLSKNFHSKRTDSAVVNEKSNDLIIKK